MEDKIINLKRNVSKFRIILHIFHFKASQGFAVTVFYFKSKIGSKKLVRSVLKTTWVI